MRAALSVGSLLFAVLTMQGGPGQAELSDSNLTTLCQFTSGPRAGTMVDYKSNGVQPIPVGSPCTDGLGSSGVAIAPFSAGIPGEAPPGGPVPPDETTSVTPPGHRHARHARHGVHGLSSYHPTLPTRAFAGPKQYPPSRFAAYGIVAFTSRAVPDDFPRYQMICEAYVASLPSYSEVSTPIEEQMVTVWPIETDRTANRLNKMPPSDQICKSAVRSYGLTTAKNAIDDARRSRAVLDGVGPFLLAWSPSGEKGKPNALVLVSNLSNVTNSEQAKHIFLDWSNDIVENPELWVRGWNIEKARVTIQLWADRYGSGILKIFGLGG
jgi:hypothetical protein